MIVVAVLVVGGSFLVASPNAKAPFFGLVVDPGAHSQPGLLRHPYLYVPDETITMTVYATAGEIYDLTMVVRSSGQILNRHDDVPIPVGDQVTREFVVPASLEDGDDYDIEVGDSSWAQGRTSTRWAVRTFAVQEYVFHMEVDRSAYIGGDEFTVTWSANKLMGGSLAANGDGRFWVHNTNRENLISPNPFTFAAASGSVTFLLPDLANPNYDAAIEGWFNSSGATSVRYQWTCAPIDQSYPVEGNCGGPFDPTAFSINHLGLFVNVDSGTYSPGDLVTVTVRTVVTPNQASPSIFDPREPNIWVSIAVLDVTGTPVNVTDYAAGGLQTDAHGELTYIFQLKTGIADMSVFDVHANASHPNGLWKWEEITSFTVRDAALGVELQFDREVYQAGQTVNVAAFVSGQGTAPLTYIFQVRDSTFAGCSGPLLRTSTQAGSTFAYDVDENFRGWICVIVTADDGRGNPAVTSDIRQVVFGWLLVNADRQEYSAGNTITVFWQLVSDRLTPANADYFVEVRDGSGNVVAEGTRDSAVPTFQFVVPAGASDQYTFWVTATEGGRDVTGSITLYELQGFFLTLSFDRSSYAPGDPMRVHYSIFVRSAASMLPDVFQLVYGLINGPRKEYSTSARAGELTYIVPSGFDEGNQLFAVQELSTGAGAFEVVAIGSGDGIPPPPDTTPPVVGAPSASQARVGSAVTVLVTANDSGGMRSVLLYWVIVGGSNGTVPMVGGSTDVFSGTIPAPLSTGDLELIVRAVDLAGNEAASVPLRVTIEPTTDSPLPSPPDTLTLLAVLAIILSSSALVASLVALFRLRRPHNPPPSPPGAQSNGQQWGNSRDGP